MTVGSVMSLAKAIRNDNWKPVATEATGAVFKSSSGWYCAIRTGRWVLFTYKGEQCRYDWNDPVGRQLARRIVG